MIVFKNVTKVYEDTGDVALRNFTETIEDGEFVLLTGESGVGKSTIIKLLLKETPITEGHIFVHEKDINTIAERKVPVYRRGIGVVFQDYKLLPDHTIYENINLARMIAGSRPKDGNQRVSYLLSLFHLENLYKRYPNELSGGQMQKVCLARAVINNPSILLADEPTGNLDYDSSVEIMHLFELIRRQGTTVLVATHDVETAAGLPYREIKLQNQHRTVT